MNCLIKADIIKLLNNLSLNEPDSISDIDKVIDVINKIPCEDMEHVIHCAECKYFIHTNKYAIINNMRMKVGCCRLENSIYDMYEDEESKVIYHVENDFCSKGDLKDDA